MLNELIEHMAKALVDNPEEVKVNVVESETRVIFELNVLKEDMGRVIGKQGRIAEAMRILLAGASAAEGAKRATLEIVE